MPPRLLRQQHHLHAVSQRVALATLVDVCCAGFKRFAIGHAVIAAIAGQQRAQLRRRRHLGAIRFVGGEEATQRTILRFEIGLRDPLDIGQCDLANTVTLVEVETPVANRYRLRQGNGETPAVGDRLVVTLRVLQLHAVELGSG